MKESAAKHSKKKKSMIVKTRNIFLVGLLALVMAACREPGVVPMVVTEKVRFDTDDPAIWIDAENPANSIIFGTDKETEGTIYAFDLSGRILEDKVIRDVRRPNNVDLEYGFKLQGEEVDIIAFSERERGMLRLYSVPDMRPLDGGGIPVFEGETAPEHNLPMGVALYKDPTTGDLSVILSRKQGPTDGTYLWQYALDGGTLPVTATRVRRFGQFSGFQEIEAVAVDDEMGFVYYSDEGVGIRKYYARPARGNEELALFGEEGFQEDMEGIAIWPLGEGGGHLVVSDQQAHAIRLYDRNAPHGFVRSIKYQAIETDGLEITPFTFDGRFPGGLLVAMSEGKVFHFYSLDQLWGWRAAQ